MPKRLKERIKAEEYDSLDAAFKEVYEEDKETGEFVLAWDGAGKDKRTLDTVRRQLGRAENRLRRLVPALADQKPEDWDKPIDDAADLLEEVRDLEFNADEYRRLKDREGQGDRKESEIQKELDDVKSKLRDQEREAKKVARELETAKAESSEVQERYKRSTLKAQISEAQDAIKVVSQKRRIARLLWEDRGLIDRVVDGEVQWFVKDGDDEIPLLEFAKDWAGTEEGKEHIAQPDHSGGGETDPPARRRTTERRSADDGGGDRPQVGGGREKLAGYFQEHGQGQGASSGR